MRNISKALLVAAAVAVPGVTLAENPAWTFGQIGFYKADSGDDDTDAFNIKGSLGFQDFHFQADYSDGDIGPGQPAFDDFDGYSVVLGWHPSVSDSTDLVVDFKYFDYTYDAASSGPDNDYDGFGLGFGTRHMLASNVELNAKAWWYDADDEVSGSFDEDVSDIALEVGGRYLFNDNISAGVTVVVNDSVAWGGDSMTIDLRYQFDDLL